MEKAGLCSAKIHRNAFVYLIRIATLLKHEGTQTLYVRNVIRETATFQLKDIETI